VAHAPLLGVTASGDSIAELFEDMDAEVREFWGLLNERFSTLSPELSRLLKLRGLGLSFDRRNT